MILLDNRIGSKHLLTKLEKDVEVSLERLEFGDVAFKSKEGKQIGIEIKNIREILSDFLNPRFSGFQVPGLLDTFDWVYLIVEGRFKSDTHSSRLLLPQGTVWSSPKFGTKEFKYSEVIRRINSYSVLGNIKVLFGSNANDTSRIILALYHWWQEGMHKHRTLSAFYLAPQTGMDTRRPSTYRLMLSAIPGLGPQKTKLLEERFISMEDLVGASERQIAETPGIGKVLAKDIYRALR